MSQPRCASVSAQGREIGGSDNREVEILSEMVGDAVSTVEPSGAHGASLGLLFSEHEVIDDERAIGPGEELAEADGAHRRVSSVEVARTLFKLIVLDGRTFGKITAQFSDTLALTHQLDFGKTKLLALGQILGRFVG